MRYLSLGCLLSIFGKDEIMVCGAISAERGRGVPGHLSRPYRRSFAMRAFVQEGDPRNPLADAAQPGDTVWSIRSRFLLSTTSRTNT